MWGTVGVCGSWAVRELPLRVGVGRHVWVSGWRVVLVGVASLALACSGWLVWGVGSSRTAPTGWGGVGCVELVDYGSC